MKNMIRVWKLVFPIYPSRLAIYLLLSLPGAILPAVMLHLQRQIVDNAAGLKQELTMSFYVRPVLCLMGTYMVMRLFALAANQYMEFGYFRYVLMGLDAKIHEKSAQLSLEYYDSAQYYKMVQGAKSASSFLVYTANLTVMLLILVCNLFAMGGYLASMDSLLVIFVALVSIPVIVEKLQEAGHRFDLVQETVQVGRRKRYAFEMLSLYGQKKELAHYGACGYVADKYLEACQEADAAEERHIRYVGCGGSVIAGVKSLFHGIAIFMMVWLLVVGRITIGSFSVLLTSFAALTNVLTQLLNQAGEILQTGIMSSEFFNLMDIEIKDGNRDVKEESSGGEVARLEHVFYRYHEMDDFTLKDISLTIRKGEKIAIVGENGAGKTTLAKLLSGFLMPTEGDMQLWGIPRNQLKENGIFGQISAVYQEFGHYKLTLAQNVYLGDARKGKSLEEELGSIQNALDWAGLYFSEHPERVMLGREFGGRELSGGQWQRLALARSYYRQRPLLFLDEPTSAIDPLEEMAVYGKHSELAEGWTVILVTHRMGAVRNADRIIVLVDGGIAEEGGFAELLEKRGHFFHIWNEQVKWYQENRKV